jgi:hypothetical protein
VTFNEFVKAYMVDNQSYTTFSLSDLLQDLFNVTRIGASLRVRLSRDRGGAVKRAR